MTDSPSLVREFAHELRNAISPIRSAMELLRLRGADRDTLPKIIAIVDRGLDSALQTIDCFVHADRAAAGTIAMSPAPMDLVRILYAAETRTRPLLDAQEQTLQTTGLDPEVYVMADAELTAQIVAALIEHASRAMGRGATIELSVRPGSEKTEVVVRCPAPEAEGADAWFSSYRVHGGGTRMALRTARRVAELQHGTLVADSAPRTDHGELVLTLPRSLPAGGARNVSKPDSSEAVSGNPSVSASGVDSASTRILLVDDNASVRTVYQETLEEMGYQVVVAENGEEALRLAEQTTPDVALIDIHLPTMNGYQLARALKAHHAAKPIRLVMLSGMTLDDTTRRLSQNAGFDDCIDKGHGPQGLDTLLKSKSAHPTS